MNRTLTILSILVLALVVALPVAAAETKDARVTQIVDSAADKYVSLEQAASVAGVATYTKEQIAQARTKPAEEKSPTITASMTEAYQKTLDESDMLPVSIATPLAARYMSLTKDDPGLQAARITNAVLQTALDLGFETEQTARVICGTMQGIRESVAENNFNWDETKAVLDELLKTWAADPALAVLDRVAQDCLANEAVEAATYVAPLVAPQPLGNPPGPNFDTPVSTSGGPTI
jgi:hypothetical protein